MHVIEMNDPGTFNMELEIGDVVMLCHDPISETDLGGFSERYVTRCVSCMGNFHHTLFD